MTAFGITTEDIEDLRVFMIESADPVDLQNRVNALIGSLAFGEDIITNITLSGAGDGHTFMVLVEVVPQGVSFSGLAGGSDAGVLPTQVRCYLGSSDEELLRARLAAGEPPPVVVVQPPSTVPFFLVDEQMAGGAKGQRFMGMGIYTISSLPPGLGLLPRVVGVGETNQTLNAGTTILAFADIQSEVGFSLPVPQAIEYTGPGGIVVSLEASVSVTQNGAGQFSVAIVEDPLGAATVLGSIVSQTGAGETDTAAVYAFATAFNPQIATSRFGLLVTSGAGVSLGSQLRITGLPGA